MTLLTLFFLALIIILIILVGGKILVIGFRILIWIIIILGVLALITWFF